MAVLKASSQVVIDTQSTLDAEKVRLNYGQVFKMQLIQSTLCVNRTFPFDFLPFWILRLRRLRLGLPARWF